ncbi:MAG TPA: hypothetical protein VIN39_00960 [Candidatus Dormibacteraeota bacterium]
MADPLNALTSICFRHPAAPAPARPRITWRSRAFGGGALRQAADRESLAKKEVTWVGRKEEVGGWQEEVVREEVLEEEVVSSDN